MLSEITDVISVATIKLKGRIISFLQLGKRARLIIASGCVVVIVIASFILISNLNKDKSNVLGERGGGISVPTNQTPAFKVLLPDGKTQQDVGGFALVSPEGSAPAYAYKDKIGNVAIRVSQQQLPDNFKANPQVELELLAKNSNANKTLVVNLDTAYLGTSAKGPQTVIMQKSGLLIFITSDSSINEVEWVEYIAKLK